VSLATFNLVPDPTAGPNVYSVVAQGSAQSVGTVQLVPTASGIGYWCYTLPPFVLTRPVGSLGPGLSGPCASAQNVAISLLIALGYAFADIVVTPPSGAQQ